MNNTDITGNEHVISQALNYLYFNIASDIYIVGRYTWGLILPTITEIITIK